MKNRVAKFAPQISIPTVIAFLLFLFIITIKPASAQVESIESGVVRGMSGQIAVVPNPDSKEITVAFTSNVPLNATSSQIVFVLQGNFSSYPTAWSGAGRVLVSKGFLAVLPSDVENASPDLDFKFSDQAIPDSVRGWTMNTYDVYGIARFGETKPLTQSQVTELETTGQYTKTASMNLNASQLDAAQMGVSPKSVSPADHFLCTAGGPGSSGCGADGCTVSCSAEYYSRCYGGVCICHPE